MIKHKKLYNALPEVFGCKKNCNDCCGPVPLSAHEAAVLGIPGAEVTPTKPNSLTCAFRSDNGCSVYENRPFLCRAYASTNDKQLRCPHGACAKKPIRESRLKKLSNEYIQMMKTPKSQLFCESGNSEIENMLRLIKKPQQLGKTIL